MSLAAPKSASSHSEPRKIGRSGLSTRFGGRDRSKHLPNPLPSHNTPPKAGSTCTRMLCAELTIVVDAVDQPHPNLRVVVGHEDDVEELLAVGVELAQLRVHRFQRLQHRGQEGQ